MNLETSIVYFVNDGILAGKANTTLKGYQYSIRSLHDYTKLQFLPQELESIDEKVLTSFMIYGIKTRKWNKYTHWTFYKNLHVYFQWCVKKNLIQKNPLDLINKPKMPTQLPKSLNEKEAQILLRIVSNMKTTYYFTRLRNKALISLFLFTGLRKSEVINLRMVDVDVINGFIRVENGKGGKRREVPIEERILKPILNEYITDRERLNKTSEWLFNGTFVGRGENDNKLGISTVDRLFRKLSKELGKNVSAHKMRHTFATLLLDKTGDIYTLKELMGHSNIATTCVYLSCTRRKKTEAVNKIDLNL